MEKNIKADKMKDKEKIEEVIKDLVKNKYWYQKDGTGIKLKNMKLNHLKNCINMCKRKNLIDNVKILECALAIKENRFNKFIKENNVFDFIAIKNSLVDFKNSQYYTLNILNEVG